MSLWRLGDFHTWRARSRAGRCYHEAYTRYGASQPNLHYCKWIGGWTHTCLEIYGELVPKNPAFLRMFEESPPERLQGRNASRTSRSNKLHSERLETGDLSRGPWGLYEARYTNQYQGGSDSRGNAGCRRPPTTRAATAARAATDTARMYSSFLSWLGSGPHRWDSWLMPAS